MLFILLFMCSVDAKAWPVTVIRGAGLLAAGQDAAHGFFDGEIGNKKAATAKATAKGQALVETPDEIDIVEAVMSGRLLMAVGCRMAFRRGRRSIEFSRVFFRKVHSIGARDTGSAPLGDVLGSDPENRRDHSVSADSVDDQRVWMFRHAPIVTIVALGAQTIVTPFYETII